MDIEIFINNMLQTFLLPPGISISIIVIALLLIKRFFLTGKILLILGFTSLCLFSLPITAQGLNYLLEQDKALTIQQLKDSDSKAIVVLGSGRYKNAIEYEDQIDAASSSVLTRLRYGSYIYKKTNLPLLLSGGSPSGETISEASLMQTALKQHFNIQAKWLDPQSSNTWNNARYSYEILSKEKIKNIILVTHADHMPRSRMAFEHFGFKVTAAPLGFKASNRIHSYTLLDFLPSANAMKLSSSAMHEFIGYTWYTLRYKWFN